MKKSTNSIYCLVFGIAFISLCQLSNAQVSNYISANFFTEENPMVVPVKKSKPLNKNAMFKMNPEAEASQAYFEDLESYIHEHLVYPELAKENGIEGNVRISFTILRNGEVINPRVVQSLGTGCDKAAIALVENMPAWVPAMKYGLPIGEKKYLDINFSLR